MPLSLLSRTLSRSSIVIVPMYLYSLGLPEDAPQFNLLFQSRPLSPQNPVCRSPSTTVLDFASSAYVYPDPSTLDRVRPSHVPQAPALASA